MQFICSSDKEHSFASCLLHSKFLPTVQSSCNAALSHSLYLFLSVCGTLVYSSAGVKILACQQNYSACLLQLSKLNSEEQKCTYCQYDSCSALFLLCL